MSISKFLTKEAVQNQHIIYDHLFITKNIDEFFNYHPFT